MLPRMNTSQYDYEYIDRYGTNRSIVETAKIGYLFSKSTVYLQRLLVESQAFAMLQGMKAHHPWWWVVSKLCFASSRRRKG
jgi:hypothetical protein